MYLPCRRIIHRNLMNIITVDQVPPNRALTVQPHLSVWAGLNSGYRSAFYGYHQRGEVMHTRYPDQVGGDNLDIHSVYPGVPVGTVFATRWSLPRVWPSGSGGNEG